MDANLPHQDREITQDAAQYLLRAVEYAIDHLTGLEDPTAVLALRTAAAKAVGND